ncbi:MAG: H+transporting two-sector ATPase delta/epsilon subunit [Parcubacteria group bacterium]|nr:H+transporting two-sector ATPase delta/epsilon subunit [Parcubacteria group bacterium]
MAKTFHLTIAKVGENLFDGEAVSVIVPGAEGVLTVMANHEAFVSPLKEGKIRVEAEDGTKTEFELHTTGILEVSNNQATVIL